MNQYGAAFTVNTDQPEAAFRRLGLAAAEMAAKTQGNAQKALRGLADQLAATVGSTVNLQTNLKNVVGPVDQLAHKMAQAAASGTVSTQTVQKFIAELQALPPTAKLSQQAVQDFEKALVQLQGRLTSANLAQRSLLGTATGTPQATEGASAAYIKLSSAAQGAMLGMALFQRNVMGAAFSLIFLRFSIPAIVVAVGTLVAALMGANALIFALGRLGKVAGDATRKLEDLGQRLSSFYGSVKRASEILREANQLASRFGWGRDELVKMIDTLEKAGLKGDIYRQATMDAAAATGKTVEEVAQSMADLLKSSGQGMENAIKEFARDFDIEVKHYRNSLELAEALQKRFAGAAEHRASTITATLQKIGNAWDRFLEGLGAPLLEAFRAALDGVLAFLDGLRQGAQEMLAEADASGRLKKDLGNLQASIRALIPYLIALGRWIGRALAGAALWAVRAIKTLADALRGVFSFLKPVGDAIRSLTQRMKELQGPEIPDWVLFWAGFIEGAIKAALLAGRIRLAIIGIGTAARESGEALGRLFDGLKPLGKIIENIQKELSKPLSDILLDMRTKLLNLADDLVRDIKPALEAAFKAIFSISMLKTVLRVFLEAAKAGLGLLIADIIGHIGIEMLPIGDKLKGVLHKIFDVGLWAFILVPFGAAIAGPLGAVIALVISLILGLGLDVRRLLSEAVDSARNLVGVFVGVFFLASKNLAGIWDQIAFIFWTGKNKIGEILAAAVDSAKNLVGVFVGILAIASKNLSGIWDQIALLFWTAKNSIGDIFDNLGRTVRESLDNLGGEFSNFGTNTRALWDGLVSWLQWISGIIGRTFENLWSRIAQAIDTQIIPTWEAFKSWVEERWSAIVTFIQDNITGPIGSAFSGLGSVIETALNSIGNALGAFDSWLQSHNPFQWLLDRLRDAANALENLRRLGELLRGRLTISGFTVGQPLSSSAAAPSPRLGVIQERITLPGGSSGSETDDEIIHRPTILPPGPALEFSHAGRVPGRPGQRVPVLAEAGETFGGHPTFSRSREGSSSAPIINIYVSDSVITNESAMAELIRRISAGVSRALTTHKAVALPPI